MARKRESAELVATPMADGTVMLKVTHRGRRGTLTLVRPIVIEYTPEKLQVAASAMVREALSKRRLPAEVNA